MSTRLWRLNSRASESEGSRVNLCSVSELRSTSFLAIVTGVAAIWGSPIPGENETAYFTQILAFWDPAFLANDWTFGQPTSAYLPFVAVFGLPAAVLPGPVAAWLARAVCWSLGAIALLRLGSALGLPRAATALAALVWLFYGQSLVTAEWALGTLEAKQAAYIAVLFALDALLRRRPWLTGALAGIAVTFHPVVGGLAGLALGATLLTQRFPLRDALASAGLAVACALPGLVPSLWMAPGSVAQPASAYELFAMVRYAHHCDPSVWSRRMLVLTLLLFAFNVSYLASRREPAWRALLWFQLALLPPFALGFVVRALEQYALLSLTLFRVFAVLTPLVFLLAAAAILLDERRSRAWTLALVALALCFESPLLVARDLFAAQRDAWTAAPDATARAFRWIAENAPGDAVVLSPPWRAESFLLTRRAQVVSWKMSPFDRLGEWASRVEEFAPDLHRLRLPEEERGTAMGDIAVARLAQGYAALDTGRVRALAERYGATLMVSDADLALPELHREDGVRVYAVAP